MEVDALGDVGEQLVGLDLFIFDGSNGGCVLVEAKDLGPAAERAVDSDLVVFDLLAAADQGDVADRGVGDVLDGVGCGGGGRVRG